MYISNSQKGGRVKALNINEKTLDNLLSINRLTKNPIYSIDIFSFSQLIIHGSVFRWIYLNISNYSFNL